MYLTIVPGVHIVNIDRYAFKKRIVMPAQLGAPHPYNGRSKGKTIDQKTGIYIMQRKELGKNNEKGERKKEENYIKKGGKGLKSASFWAKNSKKKSPAPLEIY